MVNLMSWFLFPRKAVLCCCLAAAAPLVYAEVSYVPQAGQYRVTEPLVGDQVFPRLAIGQTASYMAWEDSRVDGSGSGISMLPLDANFSGVFSPIQVNETTAGDQILPDVTLLANGGAGFVWLGGRPERQQVYARFLGANGVFSTGEIVLGNTNRAKASPAIVGLTGGNAVAVYTSHNQAGSDTLQDVYAQILTSAGQKSGAEFKINNFIKYNQRTPAIAALAGGGFVAVWVSEQQRNESIDMPDANYEYATVTRPSVDIFARVFSASGSPMSGEVLVNAGTNVCANPAVAGNSEGGFMVTWSEKNPQNRTNGWDIAARAFSSVGVPEAAPLRINTFTYGDQFAPKISVAGTDYLIVWTSLQQDGSREGVFGQFVRGKGVKVGSEMLVNTDTASQQIHPAVGSDGSRFLTVWSAFTGLQDSFDVFGQVYVNTDMPLSPMNPPFVEVPFTLVNGSYKPEVRVSWPMQSAVRVDHYEVYLNGQTVTAASTTTNIWVLSNATASTTYSFQVLYVTTDERKSPLSEAAQAKTWGGLHLGGVPFEWMTENFGNDFTAWPSVTSRVAEGGPTVLNAFLSGANPHDPSTWLTTKLVRKPLGAQLAWNSQPGLIYQPQVSSDLKTWVNVGGPRFAADYTDSVTVGGSALSYYRVLRLR